MSVARLTALRLVGFKSFAERTIVEFGPGISAVVGPNGSGKSNLADALRWTFGEQGRTLRTRRSEDVIFAGSSSRRAVGMADVTLVIDNHDRLLPVDYNEVEIGRRLYRSGESEYLLNRQRVRLRDLVELLDAGNIADNAFLFIGQGMVDQALALRPEERRPLFEEAAGVRRHERRRRHAEAELVEAEANLERMRDLLGELRPQARRLAAQAEQLQARRSAGAELAEALLAVARARWHSLSAESVRLQLELGRSRTAADAALAELNRAEAEAAVVAAGMAEHADTETARRETLERKRAQVVELRVNLARVESETSALERDRERLDGETHRLEARVAAAREDLHAPEPHADTTLEAEVAALARQESGGRLASPEDGRDGGALINELEAARRKRASIDRALADGRARLDRLGQQVAQATKTRDEAVSRLEASAAAEASARQSADDARIRLDAAAAGMAEAAQASSTAEAELATARGRLAAMEASLEAAVDPALARAAASRGARLVGEGVEVAPKFRAAVSAALAHAATAFAVETSVATTLAGRRGTLALRDAAPRPSVADGRAADALLAQAGSAGGGALVDAIRRDPGGVVTRLLGRACWVPSLDAALALRPSLPPGWKVVTPGGEVITDDGVVQLRGETGALDLAAGRRDAERELGTAEERARSARSELEARSAEVNRLRAESADAVSALDRARLEHRRAAEAERLAQRHAENVLRDGDWEQKQVERAVVESASLDEQIARLELATQRAAGEAKPISDAGAARRLLELRARLAIQQQQVEAAREARRRAEITLAMDETRALELRAEAARIAERDVELQARRATLASELAMAEKDQAALAAALQEVVNAAAGDRARLGATEKTAAEARERLRIAESAGREADVRSLEARLQLEQVREQLLVELASIGEEGIAVLDGAALDAQHSLGDAASDPEPIAAEAEPDDAEAERLERMLAALTAAWSSAPPVEAAPSQARITTLRRRFHDLGAGNPFAAEEYADLRSRLDGLEGQRVDLERAITSTRELISSLSTLINDQFRTTFAALEDAFARRFTELFGGGDAQLSLTSPDDLSATGVEIHARPPGKKRQPLSMLSGGERALTAVSLLLAMLEVRPVPFCVLDEVDAALDEANVGRFARALRGLAQQTQFIVITHNRGTIESADSLYGVTLGDDAVSRVVSLRLPDASPNGKSAVAVPVDSEVVPA